MMVLKGLKEGWLYSVNSPYITYQEEDLLTYCKQDKGRISRALAVIGPALMARPITARAPEIIPLSRLR